MTAELKVTLVAYTQIIPAALRDTGYIPNADLHAEEEPEDLNWNKIHPDEVIAKYEEEWDAWYDKSYPKPIDELHEAAGRRCYNSQHRPRKETAENADYLKKSIIDSGHFSVLAHGHVTLHVEGVSRALLLELERHQKKSHLNFSVVSQRYVDHGEGSGAKVVAHPLMDDLQKLRLAEAMWEAQTHYDKTFEELREAGVSVKQARGAARMFLPESTETKFFVTASIRGWRDVLEQRLPETADEEIREFAMAVLKELVKVAPNSVQDFTEEYLNGESK